MVDRTSYRNRSFPFTPFNPKHPSYEVVDRIDRLDDTEISIDTPFLIFGVAVRTMGSTSWMIAPFAFLHEAIKAKGEWPECSIHCTESRVVARIMGPDNRWIDIDEGAYPANNNHAGQIEGRARGITFPTNGYRWTGYTKNVLDAVLEWIETRNKLGQTTDIGAIVDCAYPIYRGLVRRSIDELIGEKTLYCDENGILS